MAISLGLATKMGIGVGGIATIAGGGYAASQYFSGTKISELLEKDEYVLLKKGEDEEQWKKRWGEYVASKSDAWKLENYSTSSKDTAVVPENFKDACIYNSSLKITDEKDPNYKNVEKFCTKGFAISELIGKDTNIEIITEAAQGAKWKGVWAKYHNDVKSQDPLVLGNLSSSKPDTVPENYKTKCDAKKTEEIRNKKDKNYLTFKDWCTTPKTAGG